MDSFRAEGGVVVTDEMIDRWDEDACRGIFHGEPGLLVIRKPLEPPNAVETDNDSASCSGAGVL